jgi:hydrogenase/urease accessory protein HupE
MDDMDLLLSLDQDLDNSITETELDNARNRIEAYLGEQTGLAADGDAIDHHLQGTSIWADTADFPYLQADVYYVAPGPIEEVEIRVAVLTDLYQDHRNLADIQIGDNREQFVFQNGNTWSVQLASTGPWQTVREFTLFGIEHIVTGYDHLLFLLGLLLVGRGLRNLIVIVTAFTIAHSLTLVLATLGILNPLPWLIEAGIALSIVYVGLENLVLKTVSHRWRISFFFGLVHGFGFAGLLQQMDLETGGMVLSLFTFNLGVEIGQVAIVALAWPLLQQIAKHPKRMMIVRTLSSIIVVLGIYWFFERIT